MIPYKDLAMRRKAWRQSQSRKRARLRAAGLSERGKPLELCQPRYWPAQSLPRDGWGDLDLKALQDPKIRAGRSSAA